MQKSYRSVLHAVLNGASEGIYVWKAMRNSSPTSYSRLRNEASYRPKNNDLLKAAWHCRSEGRPLPPNSATHVFVIWQRHRLRVTRITRWGGDQVYERVTSHRLGSCTVQSELTSAVTLPHPSLAYSCLCRISVSARNRFSPPDSSLRRSFTRPAMTICGQWNVRN